ncbi:MAG: hypothetical protein IKD89_02260 [Clostridia bacterium]|nr:hypothetical protein [Clostridia bacterium]
MKNKALMCALLAVIFAVSLILSGCGSKGSLETFVEKAGVSLEGGDVSEEDTHGGGGGDGTYLAVIRFGGPREDITGNDKWKPLPLSATIYTALYGFSDGTGEYLILPLVDFESEGMKESIPKIENGYYYFEDRHAKSRDPADDTDLLARKSYNFTLAIYDSDSFTLYVLIEDT